MFDRARGAFGPGELIFVLGVVSAAVGIGVMFGLAAALIGLGAVGMFVGWQA